MKDWYKNMFQPHGHIAWGTRLYYPYNGLSFSLKIVVYVLLVLKWSIPRWEHNFVSVIRNWYSLFESCCEGVGDLRAVGKVLEIRFACGATIRFIFGSLSKIAIFTPLLYISSVHCFGAENVSRATVASVALPAVYEMECLRRDVPSPCRGGCLLGHGPRRAFLCDHTLRCCFEELQLVWWCRKQTNCVWRQVSKDC